MTTTNRQTWLYRAFGTVLLSEVPLPELHEVPLHSAAPTLTLSLGEDSPPEIPGAVVIGEEEIPYGATVVLSRVGPGRYRLAYSDTGTFDISSPERRITWWRPSDCDDDLAMMDILGRVLATTLHAEGTITLHASAAALESGAIGFMAPKHFGKSTLVAAMTYGGARLVSDDALAILPGSIVRCVPGVPSVRLRQESAAHFPRTRNRQAPDLSRWRLIDTMEADRVATEPVPLVALYELSPRAPENTTEAARRSRLVTTEAMLALTRYAKMGTLLGGREGHEHVSRVIDVLTTVPVFTLELVRDLQQLDSVVRALMGWHTP